MARARLPNASATERPPVPAPRAGRRGTTRPPPPAVELALERLRESGEARARAMFGGYGFYLDGLFVAIEADGRLYLKADALSAPEFAQAGGEAFVFRPPSGGTPQTLGYWSVPDEALESPGGLRPWARLALEAALRARHPPAKPRRRAGVHGASSSPSPPVKTRTRPPR